jgi:hypothetical protein
VTPPSRRESSLAVAGGEPAVADRGRLPLLLPACLACFERERERERFSEKARKEARWAG